MSKRERIEIQTHITHYNIQYNESKKYRFILDHLETEIGLGYRKELWCFITNTARAIKYRAVGLSVPRDFKPYKENVQKISHKRMVALLDILEGMGHIDLYIGGIVDWHTMSGVGSIAVLSSRFLSLFDGVDVSDEVDHFHTVEIKDRETGALKSNKGVRGVGKINIYMDEYNEKLINTEISKGQDLLAVQQYKRSFSDRIGFGGRHYNTSGGVQVMNQDERSKLKINGEAVSELDFKAMHPSILYEQEYATDPESVGSWIADVWGGEYNPYGAQMPFLQVNKEKVQWYRKEYNNPTYNPIRNLSKHALMVCLNAKTYKRAFIQVTEEFRAEQREWEQGQIEGSRFYGIEAEDNFPGNTVCQAVRSHNKPIENHFYKDKGVQLQYVDSEIVAEVLNRLLMEDEVLLPEHDSVIVRSSIKDKVYRYMREAYKDVMGSDEFCYIEEK